MSDRRSAPATDRNREPIRDVLARVVPASARVLEIASGSGQHAVYLAAQLDVASWQPTDPDATARASVDAWRAHEAAERVLPCLALDVTRDPWPTSTFDAVVCINMIHIAPWEACLALLDGASRVLEAGSVLFLYGPFRREGHPTAPSNEAFDRDLRARDPRWGVRSLETVAAEAQARGFSLEEVVPMPANNLSVVFRRTPNA